MSMKMVCNRCNKVKEDGESFDRIRYICSEPELLNEEYDLCPECSKLFSIFLDGGEVEEDHYKDSKPSAVVIHKLASGHYGIENVPKPKKNGLHCATCAYQWDPDKCPRVKETPGTISCENDAEACDKWSAFRVECGLDGAAMDKEESDLSVTMTKSSSGVYMPDGKPWTTGKKIPKVCKTCHHQNNAGNEEPCCHCNVIDPGEWDSKWTQKEKREDNNG